MLIDVVKDLIWKEYYNHFKQIKKMKEVDV